MLKSTRACVWARWTMRDNGLTASQLAPYATAQTRVGVWMSSIALPVCLGLFFSFCVGVVVVVVVVVYPGPVVAMCVVVVLGGQLAVRVLVGGHAVVVVLVVVVVVDAQLQRICGGQGLA